MATLERTYIVPLRREWLKVPLYRRAKKATTALREFLEKHMKSDKVLIGKELNEAIWGHGMRNPPHKIKCNATKGDDGVVRAELFGVKTAAQKADAKTAKKDAKSPAKAAAPKSEAKAEAKADAPKADAKPKADKPAKETKPKADKKE